MPPTFSPRNDVWETSAEIPYWWRVATQTWIVLLIGRSKFPSRLVQSEALLGSVTRYQCGISVFFWRQVAGKPVVASGKCRLFPQAKTLLFHFRPVNRGILCPRNGWQSSSLAWSQVILISWAFYSRTATNGHFPIRGWFSYRTGTSVDDSARKSNNWPDQCRATNWAPEVEFSRFRALFRRQMTFAFCC